MNNAGNRLNFTTDFENGIISASDGYE